MTQSSDTRTTDTVLWQDADHAGDVLTLARDADVVLSAQEMLGHADNTLRLDTWIRTFATSHESALKACGEALDQIFAYFGPRNRGREVVEWMRAQLAPAFESRGWSACGLTGLALEGEAADRAWVGMTFGDAGTVLLDRGMTTDQIIVRLAHGQKAI